MILTSIQYFFSQCLQLKETFYANYEVHYFSLGYY